MLYYFATNQPKNHKWKKFRVCRSDDVRCPFLRWGRTPWCVSCVAWTVCRWLFRFHCTRITHVYMRQTFDKLINCQLFKVNEMKKKKNYIIPLFSLIACVEKLQWAPAPFQSPGTGFGSSVTTIPNSSATRCNMKRAIHKWSPMLMPSHGPTWNSHWNQ